MQLCDFVTQVPDLCGTQGERECEGGTVIWIIVVTIAATFYCTIGAVTWVFVAFGVILAGDARELWKACLWGVLWPVFWWRFLRGTKV